MKANLVTILLGVAMVSAASGASEPRFLGNIWQGWAPDDYARIWNQLTCENHGKWGPAEPQQGNFKWGPLDAMYEFAATHSFPVKQHCFVWGMQEPSWIADLSDSEVRTAVTNWMGRYMSRYGDQVDMIDVVNEPISQPFSRRAALGGAGTTGWDWVIWCYERAREFAPNATLVLNEHTVLRSDSRKTAFLAIVNLLKDRGLVDAIGLQGHWLEGVSAADLARRLSDVAAAGLPIYISELDISSPSDGTQLALYQKVFPALWAHPSVRGVTLWGYLEGAIWRTDAYLVRRDGSWRPALTWLKDYVADNPDPDPVPAAPADLSATPISTTQIDLSWTDNSTNEASFVVERRQSGTSNWVSTTLGPDTSRYSDTGLRQGTKSYYQVWAYNAAGFGACSGTAAATTLGEPPIVLVPSQSTWKYNDTGLDLGTAWRGSTFDDTGWSAGSGILGYGESYIDTALSYGSDPANKRITTYFRVSFALSNESARVAGLTLYANYDDGFVAYLNGQEVARQSMPTGTVAYGTWALDHESGAYEEIDLTAHENALTPGVNVLAVEVHQVTGNSSDLVMDMELTLETLPERAPVIKVNRGAQWRYRKGTVEASTPATAWRRRGFDDSFWDAGPSPIGYSAYYAWSNGTELADMATSYSSVFLRRAFDISSPTLVSALTLDVDYDDGFIVWINAEEVARVNVAGSPGRFLPYDSLSASNQHASWSATWAGRSLPELERTNVIAVQVFNRSLTSGDLLMDLALSVVEGSDFSPAADTDRDGMPDAWEQEHLGGTGAHADDDADADGQSDMAEFIAGTDPSAGTSCFAVDLTRSGAQLSVSFPTIAAVGTGYSGYTRHYALESRADPVAGIWTAVPGYADIAGAGQTVSCTPVPADGDACYRARVWLE
ncbi:MAG: endo-1,4-beta-xylanase [Kiritimatiellae bacterium]|nr:endo-1,4-beta-xylanase [Kiritimatiellia bacterium]